MTKKWTVKKPDPRQVKSLALALGVSETLAALLVNRNLDSAARARRFLQHDLSSLHNPFLLPDMEKAVVRVRQAIDKKEKILVFGDRDVDGVTSITVLVRTLKSLGADVIWTVPSNEGYGLHNSLLQKYRDEGASLVITVDCGTSAIDEIRFANSIGMEVIVTDHHHPPETLPEALAIVNPNLKHSRYPMKELAGCLTAFKFAYALMFSYNRTFNQEFIVFDLETTGLSPMQNEILEIGAICVRNFLPVKQFHSLVKPSAPIHPDATKVHGITDEMVKNSPNLKDVLPQLMDFIGPRTIVAHNAKFDLSFLQVGLKKHLDREFNNPSIDTLSLSRECFSQPSYALGALAKSFGIEMDQAHRSIDDCRATLELFKKIEEHRDPRLQFFLEDQLDVVTLGTIADVVPLLEENRAVVKNGLPRLLQTRKVGLRKLIQEAGLLPKPPRYGGDAVSAAPPSIPSAKDVAWGVTPLINAAGRFGKADLAVKLLLTNSEDEAIDLLIQIVKLNEERKKLQKKNNDKFFALAEEQCDLKNDRLLFVVAEGLEHGVSGIVASQFVREFGRPAVLLIKDGESATGSSRSIPNFNVVEALAECKDLLVKYGGHPAAAGLTVQNANIEALRARLKEIGQNQLDDSALMAQIDVDLELDFDQVTTDFIQEISKLEPYGQGNPLPVFALRGVRCEDASLVGAQKNHLRLKLSNMADKQLGAIGWRMDNLLAECKKGERLDVCFGLEINTWENRQSAQLVLNDLMKTTVPSEFFELDGV